MIRQIYKYEVTVQITWKTGKKELRTVLQHAYSVGDAVIQAIYVCGNAEIEKFDVVEVGPPSADVREQEAEMKREIAKTVERLMSPHVSMKVDMSHLVGKHPKDDDKFHTDAVGTTGSKATISKPI